LEWILLYKFKSDRIDRIIRIFFCLHQFPEEIDETQSTLGGKKCFRLTIVFYLISLPRNFADLMLIITYPAEGDRVFFVSSGNKE